MSGSKPQTTLTEEEKAMRLAEFNRFCELMRSFTNQIYGDDLRNAMQNALANLELINAE